jgi:carbamoyl-phosphate synthase large subunit
MTNQITPKKQITILLTSAGGLTGVFLSKHFKSSASYKIVGVDMSNQNPLMKWIDVFYKVPSTKDNNFLNAIEEIINNEKVDVLIPISSYDVDFFSNLDIQNKLNYVKILTMNYSDHVILHDKELSYKFLASIGLKTPKIYYKQNEINYPCIIKPKRSSGSRNTIVLNNENDLNYWSKIIEDAIIVEFLEGKEFTVDCLFNEKGLCIGSSVRERVKTSSGGATISTINNKIKVDKIIKNLENTKKIKGPINFQFKINSNHDLCIFDFNTRFASGGLALTVKSGFDIPNLLIKLLLGENVSKWETRTENDGLTMIKYYDEYFMYE